MSTARIAWEASIGQERIKEVLSAAFINNTIGHAYLLCGNRGCGTLQVAVEFAMALLCSHPRRRPCRACEACRKVAGHAHPDFHMLFPVVVKREHRDSSGKLNEAGWGRIGEMVRRTIGDPYGPRHFDGIPTVPLEWIREVTHAINRGAVAGSRSVSIFCDVDKLTRESANTMLKTLEEPPPDTVMLLLTERPRGVLPTIYSRCQVLRFGMLSTEQIGQALAARYPASTHADVREQAQRFAMGSFTAAIELVENPQSEAAAMARRLLSICSPPRWQDLAEFCDAFGIIGDAGTAEQLFLHIGHEIRSAALGNGDGGIPGTGASDSPSLRRTDRLIHACDAALAAVRARGNLPLVMVHFILSVTEILHEQKQQTC